MYRYRLLFYRVWRLLPRRVQDLLVYLGAPKVTLGVSAVIRDAQGRLLLLRHTYRHPAWGLPGGLARRGEPPEEALARELREELGTAATIGPLLHVDYSVRRRHLTPVTVPELVALDPPSHAQLVPVRPSGRCP